MVMEAAITLQNVSAGHGHRKVLSGVSAAFRKGTVSAVAGMNGTGKSTLLKTISGLVPLLDGSIEVCGIPLLDMNALAASRCMSIVLTERFGGFNLTVRDAVSAGQMPYTNGFYRLTEKNLAKVDRAMKLCGIEDISAKPLAELSDGMFQKTMIARAVAQDTPVILLDEPTAFLDYRSRHELFLLLRTLATEGRCIVVSSHDLDLILRYCDDVLLLFEGTAEHCDARTAREHPRFREIGGNFLA